MKNKILTAIAVIMSLALIIAVAGCTANNSGNQSTTAASDDITTTAESTDITTTTEPETSYVLETTVINITDAQGQNVTDESGNNVTHTAIIVENTTNYTPVTQEDATTTNMATSSAASSTKSQSNSSSQTTASAKPTSTTTSTTFLTSNRLTVSRSGGIDHEVL